MRDGSFPACLRRLNVYSAYEYLERRFDARVRTLAAVIFILWRVGWMATAMYVPCLAVHAATSGAQSLRSVAHDADTSLCRG